MFKTMPLKHIEQNEIGSQWLEVESLFLKKTSIFHEKFKYSLVLLYLYVSTSSKGIYRNGYN